MNYVKISYHSWSILHTKAIKYLDPEEKKSIDELVNSLYPFKSSEVIFGLNYNYVGDKSEVLQTIGSKSISVTIFDSINFSITKCQDDWFLIKINSKIKDEKINGIFLCNRFYGLLEFLKENIIKD